MKIIIQDSTKNPDKFSLSLEVSENEKDNPNIPFLCSIVFMLQNNEEALIQILEKFANTFGAEVAHRIIKMLHSLDDPNANSDLIKVMSSEIPASPTIIVR